MRLQTRLSSAVLLRAVPALMLAAVATPPAGCIGFADPSGPAEAQPEDTRSTDSPDDLIVGRVGVRVRGVSLPGAFAFLGLPYAAPPTGQLRWQPPRPPAGRADQILRRP